VRRLAYEAADCGLLSADLAAGIRRVNGVKKLGVRLGNWLRCFEPDTAEAAVREGDADLVAFELEGESCIHSRFCQRNVAEPWKRVRCPYGRIIARCFAFCSPLEPRDSAEGLRILSIPLVTNEFALLTTTKNLTHLKRRGRAPPMQTEGTSTSTAGPDVKELLAELEVPFSPDQVQWRVTNTTNDKKRGQVVPYADPRAYTDRLNELFSPQGWTREYKIETVSNITRVKKGESILSGKVLVTCTVTIFALGSHSGTGEEWADDDNGITSADAQAFKRACSCFGLGRGTSTMSRRFGSIWTRTGSRQNCPCCQLGRCRKTGARECGRSVKTAMGKPTQRPKAKVRTPEIVSLAQRH
jgi:hypothetical protein